MTADVAAWPAGVRLADGYRRFRAAHPVHVLRWLRNGMLLSLAAAALLYLLVAIQAGRDISAARRTQVAVTNLENASVAVAVAEKKLAATFTHEDVTLVGTGSDFVNKFTQVSEYLTLAAENVAGNSAAGTEGASAIQFVEDELTEYLQQSETAVSDYDHGPALGRAGQGWAQGGEANVTSAISDLLSKEQTALRAQRATWALTPSAFSWALLAPVLVMLALFVATVNLLAGHFRRAVSPLLWVAFLVTALTMAIVGVFNAADARSLAATRWEGSPVTIVAVLLLLLAAAVLTARAYQPRLAEYRFEPS